MVWMEFKKSAAFHLLFCIKFYIVLLIIIIYQMHHIDARETEYKRNK